MKKFIEFEYRGHFDHIAPQEYKKVLARSVLDLLEQIGYTGIVNDAWYIDLLDYFINGGLTYNYGDFIIRLIDNTPEVLKALNDELKSFLLSQKF